MLKDALRKLFGFILNPLERGEGAYEYKPSHRTILLVVAVLFAGLATSVLLLSKGQDMGYLFPVIIFGAVSLTGLIVGLLGSDRAVAKIWGTGGRR